MKTQTEIVKLMFNEMSDEYDNLKDLYYSYTFSIIDSVLNDKFRIDTNLKAKPLALDVGCGTGIQSLRLAQLGYKVVGVDLSENLIEIANTKLKSNGFDDAEFIVLNAEKLPFENGMFDAVNCCGPTLPFIEKWESTLNEIQRVSKSKGKFLLEVEGKWNFDIFWEVINALGFNFLGYDESLGESLSHFKNLRKGHKIDYSFKLESGDIVSMPLKLFTVSEINQKLHQYGYTPEKRYGLHSITNLIPSTVLHESEPKKVNKFFFNVLSNIERKRNSKFPFNSFACSLLIYSLKTE